MGILHNLARKAADKAATERINSFTETPFAANDYSKLYGKTYELNGYQFLNLKMLGPIEVATHDGCKVMFEVNEADHIEVDTDSMEITTDFSITLGIGITEFEVDLNEELLDFLKNKEIQSISVKIKDVFAKLLITDREQFKQAITAPEPEVPAQETTPPAEPTAE